MPRGHAARRRGGAFRDIAMPARASLSKPSLLKLFRRSGSVLTWGGRTAAAAGCTAPMCATVSPGRVCRGTVAAGGRRARATRSHRGRGCVALADAAEPRHCHAAKTWRFVRIRCACNISGLETGSLHPWRCPPCPTAPRSGSAHYTWVSTPRLRYWPWYTRVYNPRYRPLKMTELQDFAD